MPKILVVDDEPRIVEVIQDSLTRALTTRVGVVLRRVSTAGHTSPGWPGAATCVRP
jgi:CheY-like chemotaxis protein